jgi:nicotinate-nucleotide--dimethylbenzimidazole phosphoribosyltransferase
VNGIRQGAELGGRLAASGLICLGEVGIGNTTVAAALACLLAVRLEPAVQSALVAGQRSREPAHAAILGELGLEPLLQLRLRAGEGVGACPAAQLLLTGLHARQRTARVSPQPAPGGPYRQPPADPQ